MTAAMVSSHCLSPHLGLPLYQNLQILVPSRKLYRWLSHHTIDTNMYSENDHTILDPRCPLDNLLLDLLTRSRSSTVQGDSIAAADDLPMKMELDPHTPDLPTELDRDYPVSLAELPVAMEVDYAISESDTDTEMGIDLPRSECLMNMEVNSRQELEYPLEMEVDDTMSEVSRETEIDSDRVLEWRMEVEAESLIPS